MVTAFLTTTLLLSSSSLAAKVPRSATTDLTANLHAFTSGSTSLTRAFVARQIIQSSDIPSECTGQCSSIVDALNDQSCQTNACACTTTNVNGLVTCLNCVVAIAPTTALRAQAQGVVDQFVQACNTSGNTVSSGTLSGSSPASTSRGGAASLTNTNAASGVASATQSTGVFFSSTGAASGTPTRTTQRSTSTSSLVSGGDDDSDSDSSSGDDSSDSGTGGLGGSGSGSGGKNGAVGLGRVGAVGGVVVGLVGGVLALL